MTMPALGSLLVGSGAVTRDKIIEAQRRRTIYGGTLDTVLLEMGAVDERTLTAHLAEASGLPAPLPERLGRPDRELRQTMSAEDARRLSAAPFGRSDGVLDLALHPEADADAIAAWADTAGLKVTCFVVLEARFRELMAVLYGDAVSPRFVSVLARLMGAVGARQRSGPAAQVTPPPRPLVDTMAVGPRARPAPTPAPTLVERAPTLVERAPAVVERAPEPEPEPDIEIVEDAEPADALLEAAGSTDVRRAREAIAALVERREVRAVPILIRRLGEGPLARDTHAALVTLARQDFGPAPRSWQGWWDRAQNRSRIEWLFEALGHKRSDLRLAASEELEAMTGAYFGYHFDLPERDREEARRRWSHWWQTSGKPVPGARAR
jgi:hypothetical protein